MIRYRQFSALEKYIPGARVEKYPELSAISAAQGEFAAYQIGICEDTFCAPGKVEVVEAPFPVSLRTVELMPVRYPGPGIEGDWLSHEAGLYSDLLKPVGRDGIVLFSKGQWRILYCSFQVPENCVPGKYRIKVRFSPSHVRFQPADYSAIPEKKELVCTVTVLPFVLKKAELLRLEWFHCDCLAAYYKTKAWSEKHWRIVENFADNAIRHGINVLYTPLWTQPLDIGVGLKRPDCQLLQISFDPVSGKYSFDFTRLKRYLNMGNKLGFRAFAMSHIFSQWGAKYAPLIRVGINGKTVERFGWKCASDSAEYCDFLRQLFPALLPVLRQCGKKCYFSLSDEPSIEDLDFYAERVKFVRPLLEEFETIEAMSNIEFYRRGLVRHPVAAFNHIEPFRKEVKELCGYYCISQADCTNRFMAMPLRRTRMIGVLSFCYDLKLFLQWGFNFYFAWLSSAHLDPFSQCDANGVFAAGDAFIVYPGADGTAWDSLRHEAFRDGLQDLAALEMLSAKIGRKAVLKMISDRFGRELTMLDFPENDEFLIGLRAEVYGKLAE